MLEADAELLQQALVNLVRNAVEAMSGGGVLTLAARREGSAVVLTVRDTGPGIAEEHIERIFQPVLHDAEHRDRARAGDRASHRGCARRGDFGEQ